MFGFVFFFGLTELFAYIWYLIIILRSTVTAFTIFTALYKCCLIYPICLLQYTYWSGSSHESLDPQGPSIRGGPYALPLALRDLYLLQFPTNLVLFLFLKKADTEKWDHAQIFLFFHPYPAVLHVLQYAFSPVSISDVFSHMKLRPNLVGTAPVKIALTWISVCINFKLQVNAKTCTIFLLVQHCL